MPESAARVTDSVRRSSVSGPARRRARSPGHRRAGTPPRDCGRARSRCRRSSSAGPAVVVRPSRRACPPDGGAAGARAGGARPRGRGGGRHQSRRSDPSWFRLPHGAAPPCELPATTGPSRRPATTGAVGVSVTSIPASLRRSRMFVGPGPIPVVREPRAALQGHLVSTSMAARADDVSSRDTQRSSRGSQPRMPSSPGSTRRWPWRPRGRQSSARLPSARALCTSASAAGTARSSSSAAANRSVHRPVSTAPTGCVPVQEILEAR